jgi:hypothetical protein
MTSITQDPIDRITLRIEQMRRVPGVHGPAGFVHNLILDFFTCLLRLLAGIAEQVRNGTLPDTAPAGAPDQPRAWPPDPQPRQRGWLKHRSPEAAWGARTMHGPFEQPEMPPEIKQPVVEQPTGRPLPRRARLRKLQDPTRQQPRSRSMWTTAVGRDRMDRGYFALRKTGFLRFDSKKWVCGSGDNCVHFVTI